MKYQFIPFDKKPDKRFPASTYDGITVRDGNSMTIGKAGWHRFDGLKAAKLSYAPVQRAIYVEPSDEGDILLWNDQWNHVIRANLSRVMPTGRSYFKENRGKGY